MGRSGIWFRRLCFEEFMKIDLVCVFVPKHSPYFADDAKLKEFRVWLQRYHPEADIIYMCGDWNRSQQINEFIDCEFTPEKKDNFLANVIRNTLYEIHRRGIDNVRHVYLLLDVKPFYEKELITDLKVEVDDHVLYGEVLDVDVLLSMTLGREPEKHVNFKAKSFKL
jgi:hypothetical protein